MGAPAYRFGLPQAMGLDIPSPGGARNQRVRGLGRSVRQSRYRFRLTENVVHPRDSTSPRMVVAVRSLTRRFTMS
ncbi:hypothetical protein GCM10023318_22990 [Nocardia callitridis]|uniref:Uncharacterized protein n=1 Tax=Nocardia callitridis TaxID=648753 RepID=A0ABP9K535_9NOCA